MRRDPRRILAFWNPTSETWGLDVWRGDGPPERSWFCGPNADADLAERAEALLAEILLSARLERAEDLRPRIDRPPLHGECPLRSRAKRARGRRPR